jgi:hypothetical protein
VNHLQSLVASHPQPPRGKHVGMRLGHDARLNPRCFVTKSSSFWNHCESENSRAVRGRGFLFLERGRSATAHTLIQRFFLVPELLIILPKSKISNLSPANSFDETRSIDRPATAFEYLFSDRPRGNRIRKIVAKFPGGGGCHDI